MKVFISWSGHKGKAYAEILYEWLPNVLQTIKPFFSPDDIVKGSRWNREISKELEESQIGIIVVTKDSLLAPWVMFEAGALSKNLGRSRVAPILFDLDFNDIRGPLSQFQCSKFNDLDMKQILRMLNSESGGAALTETRLETAFLKWWPELNKQFAKVIPVQHKKNGFEKKQTDREILEEILKLTKAIARNQSESHVTPHLENFPKRENDLRPKPNINIDQFGTVSFDAGAMTLESVKKRLDSGRDLIGANLQALNLSGMDLSDANLKGANLCFSNLTAAKLVNANLDGANLEQAILDKADLKGSIISRTNLWRASLRDVKNLNFVKSMDEANFYRVHLNETDREIVSKHSTLNLEDYPKLYEHYLHKGMSLKDLRELFLWAAHTYPEIKILG